MINVLFVCEHNSGRSQMAEAYLKKFGYGIFHAESAGLEPGTLNPHVVESMREDGIDISHATTDSVFGFFREERRYDVVITVCSQEADQKCPLFPGKTLRLNWPFPDPAHIRGDDAVSKIRVIRDEIKGKIIAFVEKYHEDGLKLFLNRESHDTTPHASI
jgi:arsenate reductase